MMTKGNNMRKLLIILLIVITSFLLSCGGGGGDSTPSTQNDTSSESNGTLIRYTPEVFAASANAYNFNDDGTALLSIEQLILNQWENPFPLDSFNAADAEGKRIFYEAYIATSITQADSLLPIYAPQGIAGDFIVDVNNSSIDFTSYKLPADIDGDGHVTLEEDVALLIDALIIGSQATLYDLNNDSSVDNRDLLYLISRLLTQANSFHFYTTDGQELGIAAKLWNDTWTVDLSSLSTVPSQVRIIVRDINGASSVKNEPSITKDEWYSSSTVSKAPRRSSDANTSCSIESSLLSNLFPLAESEFVIGFQGSVKHVMGHTIDGEVISQSDILNCFNEIILYYYNDSEVHKYFVPDSMNEFTAWGAGGVTIAVRDGFNYSLDLLKNLDAFNDYSKDIQTEVHGRNVSIKNNKTVGGKIIYTYSMVHIQAVYQESDPKYPLSGKIIRDGNDPYDDCGNIILNRFAPASQTDSKISNELQKDGMNASYEFQETLAMGHHKSLIKWPEGATYELDDNYMFVKDETSHDFNIPSSSTTVTGDVLDANDEPVEGVELSLISTCPGGPDRKFTTSKADGSYEFQEVYIGEYSIQIENSTKAVVAQKGGPVNQDIKTETLWKLNIALSNVYGSGAMSVKKFPINSKRFKMANTHTQDGWIAWVLDNTEAEVSFTGSLYYATDISPLEINYEYDNNYYLHFNAIQDIPNVPASEDLWVSSDFYVTTSTSVANGKMPSDFEDKVSSETKIEWTATGEQVSYTFTLEPCKNSECTDAVDFEDEFNGS